MVERVRIATNQELIYYLYKTVKRHSYIEIYRHVYYIQISRLLPISVGSIDIKEKSGSNLNVGGTLATSPPSFDDSSKL